MKKFPNLIYYSDEPKDLSASSREIYDNMNYIFKSDSPETQDFKTLRTLAEDLNIRDGKTCRKLADCYNYGLGTQQDLASAVMWYGIAADEYKDGMSSYKLGQMYLHGNKAPEVNEELGNFYCKQAFYIFRDEIENTKFFIGLDKNDENLELFDGRSLRRRIQRVLNGSDVYERSRELSKTILRHLILLH